ncbi:MAG: CSLREA domain-containing protein [Anaerolineae bacterium]|nr:CSLREA domain-containing protein [Anaerolineae bacterium]
MTKPKGFALGLAISQVLIALPLLFWLFQHPTPVSAANLTVNTFSDLNDGSCGDGSCSLRDAVTSATAGDTIYLPAGSYLLSAGLGQINVGKSLTFVGQGATAVATLIDGSNATRLFNITAGSVTFTNLTLQNGQPASGSGGAISSSSTGTLTLDNTIVRNNSSPTHGGGVYLTGGTLNVINGSEVTGNTAVLHTSGNGGGLYTSQGTINLTDSTVADNSAQFGGGIGLNQSNAQLNITNSQILRNQGLIENDFTGGGINGGAGSIIMHSGLISGNTAFRGGGALVNAGSFTLNGGTITDNESNYGGGIYLRSSTSLLTMNGGQINGNRSVATIFGGGALYIFQGQAVQNGGEMNNNTAINLGGAMEVRQGSFTMNGGTISGNSAGNVGGAIYNDIGTVTLNHGTLTGNSSASGGGALATGATSHNTVNSSVIYNNSAPGQPGGGIHNTGTLTLTNVTLSGNSAANGGGLYNTGTATLSNVTVYENTAVTNGGGLYGSSGTLNLVNTLLGGNSAASGADCAGTIVSQGHNLIQSSSGCTVSGSTTGNIGGNPQLEPLALNGGSTLNHALSSSSPALDAGSNPSCASSDQRNAPRPVDGLGDTFALCDIGAFEYGIQLEIGPATVLEGDSGTVAATFVVTRSLRTSGTDTVTYATVADTADGSDFTAVPPTQLTFTPGVISQTITVDVLGDVLEENDETFLVQLSSPSPGVFFSQASGLGTIVDDDGAPKLSIADVSLSEGNSGSQVATFVVNLSLAWADPVTVNYATSSGTAVAPSDYQSQSGQLTFIPGDTQETIAITIFGDTMDEWDETFLVTLSNATNATISDNQATGTLSNDDTPPSLSIADTSLSEGSSGTKTAVFTVTLAAISGKTVTVDFATMDETAVAPADYTAQTNSLSFAPGETQKNISVSVVGDTVDEIDETFLVNLSSPSSATLGDEQARATLSNDDTPPSVSINHVTASEGGSAGFTVSLSQASGKPITVPYSTLANSATAGVDFAVTSGELSFAPGETSQPLTVPVLDDALDEVDETFWVVLSSPTNASLAAEAQGQATITDNDNPPVLSISGTTVTEGDSGLVTAVFTVTLSQASSKVITVAVNSSNGSATAGVDYTAVATTLTFTPGSPLSQTVSVNVLGDETAESSETFLLTLSSPSSATLGQSQATATILDDDGVFIYLPFVIKP